MRLQPRPLNVSIVVSLIGGGVIGSLTAYLGYHVHEFKYSKVSHKTIWVPLWMRLNYFDNMKRQYDIQDLEYLDQDLDMELIKKRINFKIMNLVIQYKLLELGEFRIVDTNTDFKFSINTPAISGLAFDLSKNQDNSINMNVRWIIKLINTKYWFKLNQPKLSMNNDISFRFCGEYGIYNLLKLGKIKFDGVISNDVKFTNVVVDIEDDKLYKIV